MLDILVRGGTVIDGTGNPGYRADVHIRQGRIVRIIRATTSDSAEAATTLDATGRVVSPGFIDTHAHSDLLLLENPQNEAKLRQGVTTEILGQDGLSVAPLSDTSASLIRKRVAGLLGTYEGDWSWRSLGDYFERLEAAGTGTNVMMLAPHGTIRTMVLSFETRPADSGELVQMQSILESCLEQGAVGFSTGLIYPPCSWAPEDELVAMLRVVGKLGGVFVVHIRNESDLLLESIREVIRLSQGTQVALHISHLKASGKRMWGRAKEALELLEEGRAKGADITFDQYPYIAGCTMLDAVIPPWAHEGGTDMLLRRLCDPGSRERIKESLREPSTKWENHVDAIGWENIVVTAVRTEKNRFVEGRNVADIARALGKDPADAVFDLVVEEDDAVTMATFYGNEDDVRTIMKHQLMMVCSDGILGGSKPHPRVYGTFPRILGHYTREEKLFTLQDAIRRMTSAPATRFGISDRGLVKEGFCADLVVFDPQTVIDTNTYADPSQFPKGIEHVVVNGQLAVHNSKCTGALAGRVIRGK